MQKALGLSALIFYNTSEFIYDFSHFGAAESLMILYVNFTLIVVVQAY